VKVFAVYLVKDSEVGGGKLERLFTNLYAAVAAHEATLEEKDHITALAGPIAQAEDLGHTAIDVMIRGCHAIICIELIHRGPSNDCYWCCQRHGASHFLFVR
jgi:hypothetical protein